MPVHDQIAELLRASSAIVTGTELGSRPLGTAFRISPDYAVTAAHVAPDAGGRVRLRFPGGECEAVVAAASECPPQSAQWAFDDHAVLRLDHPESLAAPCVLLAEPSLVPEGRLLICALNVSYGDTPGNNVLEVYREYRIRDLHDTGTPRPFFTIDGERSVIRGMSGGPVWSVDRGGVVGFVKASEGLEAGRGGAIAYLVDGLRRLCPDDLYEDIITGHDRYHYAERAWSDRLSGDEGVLRRWLVDIHGLLAGLAPGRERRVPAGFVDELFSRRVRLFVEPDRFVLLRDVAEYVGTECRDREGDLAEFCRSAARAIGAGAVAENLARLTDRIDWQGPERNLHTVESVVSGTTTLFGVIRAEQAPVLADRPSRPYRYEVHQRFGDQEIVPRDISAPFPDYDSAVAAMKSALDLYLSDTGGPRNAVEIVIALPDEHLVDEPLYEWRRPDERPFGRFVMRLRRSATWEKTSEQLGELDERHRRLQQPDGTRLLWLNCLDRRAESLATLHELFDVSTDEDVHDAVGVAEPPTVHVLAASADNSLPITLWRNERCPDHDGRDACAGAAFHDILIERLSGVALTEWSARIWREQRKSVAREPFWRKIIFLYDRPGESRRRPAHLAGPRPR